MPQKFSQCLLYIIIILYAMKALAQNFQPKSVDLNKEYNDDFIELIQIIYGKDFLSQANHYSMEQMFGGLDLNDKKVLDIGSGLGGIDFLIAKQFNANIIGIDPVALLVKKANQGYKLNKQNLKGITQFLVPKDLYKLSEFQDNFFDIVFSKESLLHIPVQDKAPYLKEMYRVLKPGGKIIIVDWSHSNPDRYSNLLNEMIEIDNLTFHFVTPKDYEKTLSEAGFKNISFRDDTDKYIEFCKNDIEKIKNSKSQIEKRFEEKTYLSSLKSWNLQCEIFENKEIIISVFKAEKSE